MFSRVCFNEQIAESQPLIGDVEDLSSLENEFADDEVYLAKIKVSTKNIFYVQLPVSDNDIRSADQSWLLSKSLIKEHDNELLEQLLLTKLNTAVN